MVLHRGEGPLTLAARKWDAVVTPEQDGPRDVAWSLVDFDDAPPRSFTFTKKARIDGVRVGLGREFLFYRLDSRTSVVLRHGGA